ncbi:MAG: hypothetical protein R3250_11875, partial [Melioribacteraceae bacterium]|nr:hypothetical protein [Melioribacteraceae bacterium]
GGNDLDKINEIYDELMSLPYLAVMPYAFFLHKNLVNYKPRGIIFSILLNRLAGMIQRRKEPVYIN